jgi:Tfp pilus assembly protein PilN
MIKINLLPRERVRRAPVAPRILAIAGLAAALAVVVIATLVLNARIRGLQADLEQVNAEIERLRPVVAEVEALQRRIAEARQKEQLIQQLEALRIPWDEILVELRQVVPQDVWLIRVEARPDGNLTFNGYGLSYEALARFMVSLDNSEMFEGADLNIAQKQSQGGRDVVNFSVSAKLVTVRKEAANR